MTTTTETNIEELLEATKFYSQLPAPYAEGMMHLFESDFMQALQEANGDTAKIRLAFRQGARVYAVARMVSPIAAKLGL